MYPVSTHKLYIDNTRYLAYQQFFPENYNKASVLYLSGYKADMGGTKAQALLKHCISNNIAFTCFDYLGTGESSSTFYDFILSDWLDNILLIIDKIIPNKTILVGSSMGAWLMFHASLLRPEKIHGLIGIASAADFTKKLIWNNLSLLEKLKFLLNRSINCKAKNNEAFFLTKEFWEDSRNFFLLNKPLNITCPIRLIHGTNDTLVPYQISINLLDILTSSNAHLELIKNADHRLSEPNHIQIIISKIEELLTLF